MNDALLEPDISTLDLLHRGKVRNNYAIDSDRMLMVATDRLSAYDVVLPDAIPGKGAMLTAISRFWFAQTGTIARNHLLGGSLSDILGNHPQLEQLQSRSMIVKRLRPLPVEAIVRGYLIGSGWREYQKTGSVCGIQLPADLLQAAKLPHPLFTPSTKAAVGAHDENISYERTCELIGPELAAKIQTVSLNLYRYAADLALDAGIIIADTKFEFGLDDHDSVVLMDEVLTPDSSRFWPADQYRIGTSPASFDKQFVRDYLDTLDWDQTPPGPSLPAEVIEGTRDRYREAMRRLTGSD